jgi:hypothetical protein
MSVEINRITELEAVNSMLATIAESPVTALDGTHEDAIMARQVLRQVSREVQAEGWYFNVEYDYPLNPDVNGEISIPSNMTSADIEPYSQERYNDLEDVIIRGDRLYNNADHTYVFNHPIYVTARWALNFEELPETAKTYIVTRASRLFQTKAMGSETLNQFTQADEARARAALLREDVNNADCNYRGIPNKNARVGHRTIINILQRGI